MAWARERAQAPRAVFEASYLLAGRTVRLRAVGLRLARLVSRPFAHVRVSDPGSPALTIDLYEGTSPARGHELPLAGVLASSADGALLAHARPDSLTVLDRRQGHLAGRIDPDGRQAGRERARPLSLMLAVWCGDREIQLVHAGLVARDGHGVLLGGSSGAGKSTAALACASAGFDFLGDDCVALRRNGDGAFEGHSLYCSTALAPAAAAGGSRRWRRTRRRPRRATTTRPSCSAPRPSPAGCRRWRGSGSWSCPASCSAAPSACARRAGPRPSWRSARARS